MNTLSDRTKGIFFILLAGLAFACMNALFRLSGELPAFQKAFFRNVLSLPIAWSVVRKNRLPIRLPKGTRTLFFCRAICGTLALFCNVYAVDHLLLADANMLNKLSPFFAIVASYFLLKEKVTPVQALGLGAAFLGSLLVVKPSFDFAQALPAFLGFAGGLLTGCAYTCVRAMGIRAVPSPVIVLLFSAFSCVASFPLMLLDFMPMTMGQVVFLLLGGCMACLGQFCMTAAYRFAPAKEISAFDYSQVVFSAILGFAVFGQLPDGWSVLGYVVIISAGVAMTAYTNRQEKKVAQI